jgi:hypothetical protein
MVPESIRALLTECESITGSYSDPEIGGELAHCLSIDLDDLHAARSSILLMAAPEELAVLLPGTKAEGLVLFDPERTDMSRSRTLGGARISRDAPLKIDGVRLLVMTDFRSPLDAPEWVDVLQHFIDVVVVSPNAAAAGMLAEACAALGDSPTVALLLGANVGPAGFKRTVHSLSTPDEALSSVLSRVLPPILPWVVKHRSLKLLNGLRRELHVESERLAAIKSVRDLELAAGPAIPARAVDPPEAVRRAVQKSAESVISELESELAAAKLSAYSEAIVPVLGDGDLVWWESTLDGVRKLDRNQKLGRFSQREFLLRVAPECREAIEKKVAKATLQQLTKDASRIDRALTEIENEMAERLGKVEHGEFPMPSVVLSRFVTPDAVAVRDAIDVSAGTEEKLTRPGLLSVVMLAQGGVNRVFGVVLGLIVLGGGAFAVSGIRQLRQSPLILSALLAALVLHIWVQWRRIPLIEARQLAAVKQRFSDRLASSTEAALRDSNTLRQTLHRQHVQVVRKELSTYWERIDSVLSQRATRELSKGNASAIAVSANALHLQRHLTRVGNAVRQAAQAITSLGQPADAAFRQLAGLVAAEPTSAAPVAVSAASTPPFGMPIKPAVIALPPRPGASARLGFPSKAALADLLRKEVKN